MSIKTDKIKTILSGIEGLIDRLPDETSFYSIGHRRAYELVKELIYQQFPELNESEDERVGKELRGLIKNAFECGRVYCTKEMYDAFIAYLEKQKEQKSHLTVKGKGVYKICPHCKSRMIRDDSKVYTSMPPQYGYNCPKCGTIEFDTTMYDSPEMEEQKPALRITKSFYEPDGPQFDIVDQKPAECIEFDNEFKNQVSHLLASVLNREWEYNKEFVEYTAQQLLGYAKHEISPADWSEEDEKMLKRVLETYTCYEADIRSKDVLSDNDIEVLHECAEEKIWLKGRFKSLRPFWKPSEEQMEALMDALRVSLSEPDMRIPYEPLSALYEQLKKL